MTKVAIENTAYQTLTMSFDGIKKCEFIFDGDTVEVLNPNGEHFEDDNEAESYLMLLMENANIKAEIIDADDEDGNVRFEIEEAE